jgi:hypothetical protein
LCLTPLSTIFQLYRGAFPEIDGTKYEFVRFVDISGNVEEEFEDTKGR